MEHKTAVIGEFQSGKSTFVNSVFARQVAATGEGLDTTSIPILYQFGTTERVEIVNGVSRQVFDVTQFANREGHLFATGGGIGKRADIYLREAFLQFFQIFDTPGIDSPERNVEAVLEQVVEECDAFVVILTKGLPEPRSRLCQFLSQHFSHRKLHVILNCGKLFPQQSIPSCRANAEIAHQISVRLTEIGVKYASISRRNLREDFTKGRIANQGQQLLGSMNVLQNCLTQAQKE